MHSFRETISPEPGWESHGLFRVYRDFLLAFSFLFDVIDNPERTGLYFANNLNNRSFLLLMAL